MGFTLSGSRISSLVDCFPANAACQYSRGQPYEVWPKNNVTRVVTALISR